MKQSDLNRKRDLQSRRRAQFLLRLAVVVLTIGLGIYAIGHLVYLEQHPAVAGRGL